LKSINIIYDADEKHYGAVCIHSYISQALREVSDNHYDIFLQGNSNYGLKLFERHGSLNFTRRELKRKGRWGLRDSTVSRRVGRLEAFRVSDVVVFDGVGSMLSCEPLIAACPQKVFYVVVHGFIRINKNLKRYLTKGIPRNLTFVGVSQPVADYLHDTLEGVAAEKITFVDNAIDFKALERAFYDQKYAREKMALKPSVKYVASLGRLVKEKNFLTLIEAFRFPALKGVELVILGEGDERIKLEAAIEQFGLQGRVHLLGHISEAKRYLRAFDAYVASSSNEGFGITVLEACAAKIPLLASDIPVFRYISKDSCPHFSTSSAKDLSDKLSALLAEQTDAGVNYCYSILKQRFDVSVLKESYKSLFLTDLRESKVVGGTCE